MSLWIGVDLDGELAFYIGAPIPLMVGRMKAWLAEGKDVRIFTARVSGASDITQEARGFIEAWCLMYLGQTLPITREKDSGMVELWDERSVHVGSNTGVTVEEWAGRRVRVCGVNETEWQEESG